MGLTKTFPPEAFSQALESGSWLPLGGKQPVLATMFGVVFLHDADGYWCPNAQAASLRGWLSNRDELKMILSSAGGQDRYLLAGRVEAADAQGLRPEPSEVFDFRKPPVLGGQFEVGNLSVTDFVVAVNLAGQIHDKVRNLLPGSPISQIKIG